MKWVSDIDRQFIFYSSIFVVFGKITNQTARPYLEKELFPEVRVALKNLLEHIQSSGELNKYWNAVDKQNDEARKAARRVERERKRVEMGSEYESSSEGEKDKNF